MLATFCARVALGLVVSLLLLSPRQLHHPELVGEISKSLQHYGITPKRLRVEINETALMTDSQVADRTIRALQDLGVEIAIDNFGTGYSSLGLLRGFAVKAVKQFQPLFHLLNGDLCYANLNPTVQPTVWADFDNNNQA